MQTVIVTGAGSGMGEALVAKLVDNEIRVLALDRDQPALEKLSSRYGDERVELLHADITSPGFAAELAGVCERVGGHLHGLANVAGVLHSPSPLHELSLAEYDKVFAVNTRGLFVTMQVVLQHMVAQGIKGSIVNIASTAGMRPLGFASAYCASKAAVIALSQAAALEVADRGIRINVVSPGMVDTPMTRDYTEKYGGSVDEIVANMPTGRLARPEEIAEAVFWFLGDRASYNTGSVLPVDGALVIK